MTQKDQFLSRTLVQKGSYHYLVPYIIVHLSRQVSTKEAEEKFRDLNVMFIETSAKTSYNVKNTHFSL